MDPQEENAIDSPEYFGWMLTPGRRLLDAIESNNYASAYALLKNLKQPLEESEAGDCLFAAMFCTDKLFRAVLEKCDLCSAVTNRSRKLCFSEKCISLSGSPLLAAAAFGSARHVKLLLERGCNVNAAAPEDAHPTGFGFSLHNERKLCFCAQCGNELSIRKSSGDLYIQGEDSDEIAIHRCTPLAAAIAAENQETLNVLLQYPGVWKLESSAVCRAIAAYVDGYVPHFWALSWNEFGELLAPLAHDLDWFFSHTRMQPASFSDFCSAELLEMQLKSGKCTDGDIRELLALQGSFPYYCDHFGCDCNSDFPRRSEKLLLLAEYYPEICREPKETGKFLCAYLIGAIWNMPGEALLERWKAFSGERRDLSPGMQYLRCLRAARRKECLAELAEGGTLYVAADAMGFLSGAAIRDLLRFVHIVPSPIRTGLSAFGHSAVTCSGDKALARRLFRGGFLDCEPREALLEAADTALRPLILTGNSSEPTEFYDLSLYDNRFRHWCSPRIYSQKWIDDIINEPLSTEECLARLIRLDFVAFPRAIHKDCPEFEVTEFTDSLPAAKNSNALRAKLQLDPEFAGRTIEIMPLNHPSLLGWFNGPPLALAAAAGRENNIRLLLSVHPNVDAVCCAWFDGKSAVCTPLMLALWFGHEGAARVLLDAGANRNLRAKPYQLFMQAAPAEARALAETLGISFDDFK